MEFALLHVLLFFNIFDLAAENPITPYRFPVTPVDKCPRNAAEFEKASRQKNCTGHTRYLCAPNKYLSNLIEFCTDRKRALYGKGNCVVLEGTGDLDHYSCVEKFNRSCPRTPYYDDEIYNYTACLEINKDLRCFVADKDCKERTLPSAENNRGDITIIAIFSSLLGLLFVAGTLGSIMFIYKKRKKDTTTINLNELREFLKKGQMKICHTRGIIVGCAGAGKTTLLMRLQDIPYEELKEIKTTKMVDVHINSFEVLEESTTIKAVKMVKNNEPQTIIISKDDMLKVPTESQQSKLNSDHRNNKDNDDSGASETDTSEENEGAAKPLLPNATDNTTSTISTTVNTQIQAHVTDDKAEEIDIPTMNTSVTEKAAMSTILDAVRNLSRENRRHPRITFLDFGGQSMYYAFHQIYLSPKTFYILVLDMSKSPDERVHVTEDTCGGQFESWTYKDYYKFWLRSIDSFSDINTPVIVIGTHAENKSAKDCKAFFEEFFKIVDGRDDLQRHLHTDRRFAIKFPDKGSKLENLNEIKDCIARLVQALPYWEETIRPASVIFEYILQREKKKKIVSREILSKYNGSLDSEFRLSETEITETLKFLHRVGSLLYFDEEELRNIVILDVQWFVNAFKCVITDSVELEKINNKELTKFHKTGEIDDEKLVAIWKKTQNEKNEYEKHKKEIITYMEHLGLLAICNKEDTMSSTKANSVWYYFPSMNKRKLGKDLEKLKQYKTSSILCFQFNEEGQFPLFVFYGLVSKCNKMSGWSISEEGDTRSIYENVACFTFKSHYVVICICKFQIQVQVCRPVGEIAPTILEEVQTSVEKGIKEFKKYKYKIGYKCQNGMFCCEEDDSFIALEKFPVFQYLCNKCGVRRQHFVENKICWREKGQSEASNNVNLENSHEDTDEGRTSIKRILQACLDRNVENFLFHIKKEIGVRKHLLLKTDQNGWNVMHFAAKGGNLKIFQHLQSEDLDVCSKTHDQMTVLHIATQSGHYDLCKYILENREFKDIFKSKSALGKNACHYAAEIGSVKIFQILVAEGINPEETTSNGQNVFHIACIYSKVEMCEYISKIYVDLIHKESKEGWNATLHAAKNGHTNVLRFLNAKKVSFEHRSESERNALHIACDNGHFEACEYISENFPSLLTAIDHKGRYAAHFAARSGSLEIMKYLESKTVVTQETYIGMNILHMVCLHEHIEMCKYLLNRYPDLNVKRTEKGWTTAHFVAGNGNKKGQEIEIFDMLISAKKPVDIMLLTVNGNSVLTLAIKYNAYSFADYLFANYPNLLGIQSAIDPYNTGNEDTKMLAILEKHLGKPR